MMHGDICLKVSEYESDESVYKFTGKEWRDEGDPLKSMIILGRGIMMLEIKNG
jgi:hypothetical protein